MYGNVNCSRHEPGPKYFFLQGRIKPAPKIDLQWTSENWNPKSWRALRVLMFGAILNDATRESTAEATMMEEIPLRIHDQTLNDLNMLASRPGSMLQSGKPGRRKCYLRYLVIEKVLLFHLFVMSSFSTHTLRRTKEVEGLKARNGNCSYIIQDKIQDKKCLICEQSLSTIFSNNLWSWL